jgi:hypothetical protein
MALTRYNITDPLTQPISTEEASTPDLYRIAYQLAGGPSQYTDVTADSTQAALALLGEPRPLWAFAALKQHWKKETLNYV